MKKLTFIELKTADEIYRGLLLDKELAECDGLEYYLIKLSESNMVAVPTSDVRSINFYSNVIPFPGRLPVPE